MKVALIAIASLVAGFGATTWWALESGGVAVIETRTPDGSVRSSHVWYAEPDEELWLEAGAPEHPWFLDVQRDPAITFTAAGRSARFVAQPVPGALDHARIRSLMREKYRLRDGWVGLMVDTSRSVAVQLLPAAE